MLNHKIRHLCSRIIASLAATGVFNLTSSNAGAETIDPYRYTENPMKFTASYTSNTCKEPTAANNILAYAPSDNGLCNYTCLSGFSISGGLNTTTSSGIYAGDDVPTCYPRYYTVKFQTNGVKSANSQQLLNSFVPGSTQETGYSSYAYIKHGTNKIGCLDSSNQIVTTDLSCVPDGFEITNGSYNFSGWIDTNGEPYAYIAENTMVHDGGAPSYDPYSGATNEITDPNLYLYAYYTPATFAVEFDGNGGECATGLSNETATFGQKFELPECTRSGFVFAGWRAQDNAGTGAIIEFEKTIKE